MVILIRFRDLVKETNILCYNYLCLLLISFTILSLFHYFRQHIKNLLSKKEVAL